MWASSRTLLSSFTGCGKLIAVFQWIRSFPGMAVCLTLAFNLSSASATTNSPVDVLSDLPLAFEKNLGQVDSRVRFLALGPGYRLYLAPEEAIIRFLDGTKDLPPIVMRFHGANEAHGIIGDQEVKRKTHYFIGQSRREHVTNVPSYKRIKYQSVYPGVDAIFYGNKGFLEYDLLLSPGVNPEILKLDFAGVNGVSITEQGALSLVTDAGEVIYQKPVAYQEVDGRRQIISAQYTISDNKHIGFELGRYDISRPLIIDPILSYSTFILGGNDMVVDSAGNAYIAGALSSGTDFPLDGYKSKSRGDTSAFIMKLNASATDILYAAYIGARRSFASAEAVAVDAQGNVYIAGTTDASGFPVTSGGYQTAYSSPTGFVTKLNATGDSLVYSTYVHGADIKDIAVDNSGSLYLAGRRSSSSFATTSGAYNTSSGLGVIAKLNSAGSSMDFATYFDLECDALAIDGGGNLYVTGDVSSASVPLVNAAQPDYAGGNEVFVSKLNSAGTALVYSTYLGGANDEFSGDVAVNNNGEAYVVGRTYSNDFPVTPGVFQPNKANADERFSNAFVTKLSNTGNPFLYSTYLGGKWCPPGQSCFALFNGDVDHASHVEVDALGHAYVAGYTKAYDFPLVNALHSIGPETGDSAQAPFIAKIKPNGSRLIYSWVLGFQWTGAETRALALDSSGSAYLMGIAGLVSPGDFFPLTGGAPMLDNSIAFAAKISTGQYPTIVTSSINPADSTQTISITADVQSAVAGGEVEFYSNGNSLGSAPLINSSAVLNTTLPEGAHKITAVYSLDGIVSPPVYQVITSP